MKLNISYCIATVTKVSNESHNFTVTLNPVKFRGTEAQLAVVKPSNKHDKSMRVV